MTNYEFSFEKLLNHVFIKIDGCLVERSNGGYLIFGEIVSTINEVKNRIAKSQRSLSKSIKNNGK